LLALKVATETVISQGSLAQELTKIMEHTPEIHPNTTSSMAAPAERQSATVNKVIFLPSYGKPYMFIAPA
jgi:hypothetical protein